MKKVAAVRLAFPSRFAIAFRLYLKIVFPCFVVLSGCTTSADYRQSLARDSDQVLCLKYMRTLTANIYHSDLEAVISERNVDCTRYGDVAGEKSKVDQAFWDRQREKAKPATKTYKMVNQHTLVKQWFGDQGNNFCAYSDGSVLNMGVNLCAATK